MRDYAKVAPTFWTGETGRKIRMFGRDAQVIALYLITCPGSNWIGLYYLPIPILCHEVGISKEGALKALRSLEKIDYAYYDMGNEIVWVPGAAKYQVGESLKAGDKKIIGIVNDLKPYAKSEFCRDFHRRYASLYHLPMIGMPTESDEKNEGACKGLRRGILPESESESESASEAESDTETSNVSFEEVLSAWNQTPGVKKCRRLNPKIKGRLKTRLPDQNWEWREALTKFPLTCFKDNKWKPHLEWFTRAGKVDEILEGVFDFEPAAKKELPSAADRLATDEDKRNYNPSAKR